MQYFKYALKYYNWFPLPYVKNANGKCTIFVCLKLIETVESDLLDDTLFLYSLHLTMLPVWRGIHDDELIGLKNVILDLATFMSIYLNWIIKSLFQTNGML